MPSNLFTHLHITVPHPSLLHFSLFLPFTFHFVLFSSYILPPFSLPSFHSLFSFLPPPLSHVLLSSFLSLFLPLSLPSIHFSFLYIFILFLSLFTTSCPFLLLFPLNFSSFFHPLSLSDWFCHSEWRLSGRLTLLNLFSIISLGKKALILLAC